MLVLASSTNGGGLLERNGIRSARDVSFIVYQESTWIMEQPPLYPLEPPSRIDNRPAIQAAYDAMNRPHGALQPAVVPNCRVGFVAKNGRVVIFATGGAQSGCESCTADLTRASKLADAAMKGKSGRTTVPPGTLAQLTFHTGKRGKTISAGPGARLARAEKQWRRLFATYDPLSLRGNVRSDRKELRRFLAWTKTHVEVKLAKPVQFEAIVVPPDLDPKWPPPHGDNRARLKKIEYNTAYVMRLPETRAAFVMFAFVSSRTGEHMLTDAVYPKVVVGKRGPNKVDVYGPDLFHELASALAK